MLCWVYIVDGVQAGRCAASAATTWAPSIERSEEVGGCDGLPSLETQPNCVDVTLKLGSAGKRYMSPSDFPDHPGSILYHSESSEVPYSTNQ